MAALASGEGWGGDTWPSSAIFPSSVPWAAMAFEVLGPQRPARSAVDDQRRVELAGGQVLLPLGDDGRLGVGRQSRRRVVGVADLGRQRDQRSGTGEGDHDQQPGGEPAGDEPGERLHERFISLTH